MARRRGVALVLSLVGAASLLSMLILGVIYFFVTREPVVAQRSTLYLRIGGALPEEPPSDVVGILRGGARAPTVLSLVENIRKAKVDPRVTGLVIAPTSFDVPFWGKLQEIRDAILDFKKSGKPTVAYLEYGGQREFFVATACDRIFLMPSSTLDLAGIASYEVFFRGAFDKAGAFPDFVHIGQYKTATNNFTETTFTAAHREMTTSLNHDSFEQLVRAVADGRRKSEADVRALVDRGPFLPEDAVSAGLVDDLAYEDEVGEKIDSGDGFVRLDGEDYARVSAHSLGLGKGPRIAVIYAVGTITSGKSRYDPVNGAIAGSETLVDSIRQARHDPSVRAIVLRIDSPGGSSIASDVIRRELVLARDERKDRPLVASMSDLAASGGYMIAIAAPTIVAQPGTLTGSIGIFTGKVVTSGTLAKLGINVEGVSEGRNAAIDSPVTPFSESERAKVREALQAFYDNFVEEVADARKTTPEKIDQVAQGRVWTGRQAKDHGLVDALGGFASAIQSAKQQAKIPLDTEVELVVYPPPKSVLDLFTEQFGNARNSMLVSAFLGSGDRRALGALSAPLVLFRRAEPLALMPFTFVP